MSTVEIPDRIDPEFKNLTPHQLWLLEHQMTAFWHGFGISNGLLVPKEYISEIKLKDGTFVKVHPAFMQKQLKEYNEWLRTYQEDWHTKSEASVYPKDFDDFLRSEKAVHWSSRKPVFEMVNLLQDSPAGKERPSKETHRKESSGREERML